MPSPAKGHSELAHLWTPSEVDLMLSAATRAPSLHNSQPWAFAVGRRHVEIYLVPSRRLSHSDPTGRSQFVSCGAGLFNLRVAAAHLGMHPAVELLPDRADRTLVAVMRSDHRHERPGSLDTYYPSIGARRTNRMPFRDRVVPADVVGRLADAARIEEAALHVYDEPREVERIVELLHRADDAERSDPARIVERQAWIGGPHRHDGIPVRSLGPRPVDPSAPFRDLGQAVAASRELTSFEPAPTLAVLSTAHDGPRDWVQAGQALERVLLEATRSGLAASILNQPLEHPGLRGLVHSPLPAVGHSQMLLRLGYGQSTAPPTPRLPLDSVRRAPRLAG
jgi:hypothetical protein